MDTELKKAQELLKKYNQEHIIPFLDNGKNIELINQILRIDFEELKKLYNASKEKESTALNEISPIHSINPDKLTEAEKVKLEDIGKKIIKQDKYAVVTMAGRARNEASDTVDQREHLN